VLRGRYLSGAARSCDVRTACQANLWLPNSASTSTPLASGAAGFLKDRCDGLLDEARPGRPRTIDDDQVAAVIERTLRTTPVDATHWSIRSTAAETGFSHTTIRRRWAAFGLQPRRSQTFKLSSDPLFVDKVRDIVGLYLSPPTRALVLSIDEKSQIQALDREQPVLPMMPGVLERRTHSYVRHGTTTLFAALDVASGFIIGKCYKRHRAVEFLKFLKEIDAQVPEGLDVHIIMDNYATRQISSLAPSENMGQIEGAGQSLAVPNCATLLFGSAMSQLGLGRVKTALKRHRFSKPDWFGFRPRSQRSAG
jgi:hypothetical protein